MWHLWSETWTLSDSWSSWCVLVKVWLLNTRERQMLMCVIRTDDQDEWRCTSVLVPVSPNSLCKPFKSRQTHFNSVLSSIYCHLNRACSQLSPFTFNCSLSLSLSFFLSVCPIVYLSVFLWLHFPVFLCISLSVCLSYLSIHLSIDGSDYLTTIASIYLSIYQFVCLSVWQNNR